MRHVANEHETGTAAGSERPSALLLVRCWLEPRRGAEPVLRGYVRDLRSGGEVPIADLKSVEEQLRRQLGLAQPEAKQNDQKLSA
jgi:hypothetical protein